MGIGDFFWQEQAMARHRVYRIVVWLGEHARDAHARERRHGERNFVGLEIFAREVAAGGSEMREQGSRTREGIPVAHVAFDRE